MRATFTVHHNEHVSSRPFEEVVNAFESAVGSVEDSGFPELVAATKSAEEFESRIKFREGTSGCSPIDELAVVGGGVWRRCSLLIPPLRDGGMRVTRVDSASLTTSSCQPL